MGLLRTTLTTAISLIVLTSCGNYEEFKEDPISGVAGVVASTTISFDEIREEVLKDNCLTCHPGYANYDEVFGLRDKIQIEVASGSMPQNGVLADDLKVKLLSWIAGGAQRGAVSDPQPTPVDDGVLVPTFASISRNVINKKCITCHNPNGQVPWYDFSNRQAMWDARDDLFDFSDASASYFVEVISETDPELTMPPSDSPFELLTPEEIAAFTEWISLGLPD